MSGRKPTSSPLTNDRAPDAGAERLHQRAYDAPLTCVGGEAGQAPGPVRVAAILYRPEIDGLRAFAVIPVILFHAGFPVCRGGFVGVDVFFVISGYLITSICLKEIAEGTFSLWRFYERRARRILPPLFLVTAICVPFAILWMLPDPLENFGQSVVATTLSANNILLLLTTGYWDRAAEFKPLMHTWSLAVEEQYYLLFPPLLLVLVRLTPRLAVPFLVLLAVGSLGISHLGATTAPEATFYLLPTRAFELLAGSFCAFAGLRKTGWGGTILAVLGIFLIFASVLLFSRETPFPSFYALAPVAGTVLIILFANNNVISRFLSYSPFVAIGLISYSLYLWHQPLFAFARIRSYEEPSALVYLMLVALAVLLSIVSYKLVEQPSRDRERTPLLTFASIIGSVGVGLCTIGLLFHSTQGLPSRAHTSDTSDASGMYISYNERVLRFAADAFPKNGQQNILVAGSSLARDFINMMIESGAAEGRNVIYNPSAPVCISQRGLDFYSPVVPLLRDAHVVFLPSGYYLRDHIACIRGDLNVLKSLGVDQVYWVGPKDFGYNLNVFMAVPMHERSKAHARMRDDPFALNEALKQVAAPKSFIDLAAALSDKGARHVRVFDDGGRLLSSDGVHLTNPGARFLGTRIFGPGLEGLR